MIEKIKKKGFRFYLNIATLILVAGLIWFARDDLLSAWTLLGEVNIWLVLTLLPLQILAYYAWGQMSMSYLEQRGQIKKLRWWQKVKFSLETNFVDHVMPSGGVSGASYAFWRLKRLGVDKTHAMMSQLVDATMSFASFVPLLILSAVWVSLTNKANGTMVMLAVGASVTLILVVFFGSFLISNKKLIASFGAFVAKFVNKFVRVITFGMYKKKVLNVQRTETIFLEMNSDFELLMKEKKVLWKPFMWGMVWTVVDVVMYEMVFLSMGVFVDPMVIVLAYGASTAAGMLMLTPGGIGAVETTFILVVVSSGVSASVASAGTLLTRVILLIGTLLTGYYFYHKSINNRADRKELVGSEREIRAVHREAEQKVGGGWWQRVFAEGRKLGQRVGLGQKKFSPRRRVRDERDLGRR